MTTKTVNVKRRKRPIGRRCMHCNRSATVTATRILGNGMRFDVHMCVECADMHINKDAS